MRRWLALALLVPLGAAAVPGVAPFPRPLSLAVTPACCAIGFTAYAFGLFPIDGTFGRFEGSLAYDPAVAERSRAVARIDAASLSLDAGPIEADVKAPHFLDVGQFPFILFDASAAPAGDATVLTGLLTIKGITRPVTLAVRERDGAVTAEAMISRRSFGITARPVLAGDTIAIRVTAPLPH